MLSRIIRITPPNHEGLGGNPQLDGAQYDWSVALYAPVTYWKNARESRSYSSAGHTAIPFGRQSANSEIPASIVRRLQTVQKGSPARVGMPSASTRMKYRREPVSLSWLRFAASSTARHSAWTQHVLSYSGFRSCERIWPHVRLDSWSRGGPLYPVPIISPFLTMTVPQCALKHFAWRATSAASSNHRSASLASLPASICMMLHRLLSCMSTNWPRDYVFIPHLLNKVAFVDKKMIP